MSPVETPSGGLCPAIVITGASSGIGRAIARVAARDGAFLLLLGRSEPALEAIAGELAELGATCATLALDLAERGAVSRIAAALDARGLYCDVLVNSAGYGLYGPAASLPAGEQLGILDINARALTELSLRFLPGMLARRRGGILNVGSMTSYVPGPNMAVYYATKAYVRSFTLALAIETAGSGVTVTCLTPGVVRTAFFERCKVGETRISKIYPRMDAEATAAAGWRAFRQGRSHVIPGLANRAIRGLLRFTPEALIMRLMRRLQASH